MDNKEIKGFKLCHLETSLQSVMDFYVKGLNTLGHVHRSQFFINPLNGKVIFELFIRDDTQTTSPEAT